MNFISADKVYEAQTHPKDYSGYSSRYLSTGHGVDLHKELGDCKYCDGEGFIWALLKRGRKRQTVCEHCNGSKYAKTN